MEELLEVGTPEVSGGAQPAEEAAIGDLLKVLLANILSTHRQYSVTVHSRVYSRHLRAPGALFTKYLTTVLRLSHDNAKVTIDVRWTSNLPSTLRRTKGFS